ncbi:cysteine rich repeat-containing protein [Halioxenophilus sp. WMMB6]|uniref:cysteine rich repeat-containing protein n=1 Tax=Halioxenophilus sp. WMMB6 TaxID=3073815 RepID=UPI00295E7EEC|nr:cysteine rich repeat-containing protein [Halioxenophilus sp. WMMB6]
MRRLNCLTPLLLGLLLPITSQAAGPGIIEQVNQACAADIDSFCADINPGQGRIAACLHAHFDQVSGQCQAALTEAREELKLLGAAYQHVNQNCQADAKRLCPQVTPGQGRILDCLKSQQAEVSTSCTNALKDVGLME